MKKNLSFQKEYNYKMYIAFNNCLKAQKYKLFHHHLAPAL